MKYFQIIIIAVLVFAYWDLSNKVKNVLQQESFRNGYSSARAQAYACVENSGHTPDPINTALACIKHM